MANIPWNNNDLLPGDFDPLSVSLTGFGPGADGQGYSRNVLSFGYKIGLEDATNALDYVSTTALLNSNGMYMCVCMVVCMSVCV